MRYPDLVSVQLTARILRLKRPVSDAISMLMLSEVWDLLHPNPEQISKTLRNLGKVNQVSPLPGLLFHLQFCDGTQPVSLTYSLSARCICAKGTFEEIAL